MKLFQVIGTTTSGGFQYIEVPTPPTFGTTTTITDAVGSSVESGELSGNTDVLVATPFEQRLRPNGLVGTSGTPYRFKSESDSARSWIGGSVVAQGQQVSADLNGSDFNEYYHLGLKGDPLTVETGISGFFWQASIGGTTIKHSDIIVTDVYFAGYQINEGTTGEKYNLIDLRFIRIFGHPDEGECFYIGNTNKVTFSYIDSFILYHAFGTNKGRDALQVNNHLALDIQQCTFYDNGKADIAGQNRLVQVQNCNGTIKNCVFDGAPELFDIFTHGVTFENCYFRWDSDDDGYIGKLTSQYTGVDTENNQPLTFRNCIFDPSVTQTRQLIVVVEDECNVVFEDCQFGTNCNGQNTYLDNRTDKVTYSITETGSTAYTGGTPTYKSLNINDENTHGLLGSCTQRTLGMGYRTKAAV